MVTTPLEHELILRLIEAEDIMQQRTQLMDELHDTISNLEHDNAAYEEELRTLRKDYAYTRDQLDLRECQLTESHVDNTYKDYFWYCVYRVVYADSLQPVEQYTSYTDWVAASVHPTYSDTVRTLNLIAPDLTDIQAGCSPWLRQAWADKHKLNALLHEEA